MLRSHRDAEQRAPIQRVSEESTIRCSSLLVCSLDLYTTLLYVYIIRRSVARCSDCCTRMSAPAPRLSEYTLTAAAMCRERPDECRSRCCCRDWRSQWKQERDSETIPRSWVGLCGFYAARLTTSPLKLGPLIFRARALS